MGIINYFDLEDSELFVFDEFISNQIKEGVVIEPKHNELLNEYIQKLFSGKNMVYVSNRAKSYSVNPMIYTEAQKIPNLVAIAMIPDTALMRKNAEFEKEFYDKPYAIFENLNDAIRWVHQIVSKENAKDDVAREKNLKQGSESK
ncbi:hypothetical protein ESY86_00875 [Subsaximicrobium wynnwilliamsii]|uniref:STAS/SEC14 domain-containing protein n=1 Tax=Subsaximicrobium wynnwilliamsii TaxID=291179 RepID=A0A5C6ZQG7_9FLAO|nr:hypothetical protein [Subsaximicrobium wynnwilliamsii]TXD85130.1 hypothetical protein ESY87_02045 [Subsaximicrobium wynnwilliamsii]TXD91173.1 hypothetical protein ESY86_00875 [Subsaximicrobium wynnwilliamsii]TXE04567.1 hypothetical protein ESY88_03525 [Subsaximicrobium wynnwilliamsii]